jgi:hypothetical protein
VVLESLDKFFKREVLCLVTTKLKTKAVFDYTTILVYISVYFSKYRQLAAILLRVSVPVSVLR